MPTDSLSEAVKEAYASCPSNNPAFETLQFHHSSLPDVTVSGGTLTTGTNLYAKTAHGLTTGKPVKLVSLTGSTGLTTGQTYFFIKIDADTGKLADRYDYAMQGEALTLSSSATSVVLLASGDVWVVRNREDMTLGIEPGGPGTLCGVNPGEPGPNPGNPDTVYDPGAAPPLPGNRPVSTDYVYYAGGVACSHAPFNRYELTAETFNDWIDEYDEEEPENGAAVTALVCFQLDLNEWEFRTTNYGVWQAAYDAYQAFLVAQEIYLDWVQQGIDYAAYLACIGAETLTHFFVGLSFELTLAATGTNGLQEISMSCCDVDRVISDWLTSVAESNTTEPIEVSYRVYLESDYSVPQNIPPLKLYLTDARVDVFSVSMRATFADIVNRPYPNAYYTREKFPSLGN